MSKDPLPPKDLKALFICAPGIQLDPEIIEIFSNNKDSLMIGDGQITIDPDYIMGVFKNNNTKIVRNTRIDINAHGIGKDVKHHMGLSNDTMAKTENVFRKLREIADTPLYVHLWSCYSSSANIKTPKLLVIILF